VEAIADTHALIWYLLADPRLSSWAKATFQRAAAGGKTIGVSAISLVEIVYLMEKGRIPLLALRSLEEELRKPGSVLEVVPLSQDIALAVQRVDRKAVPDMPDRIIAATALHLGLPLISRNGRIHLSGVRTIW
jgi:PIN domain nuclease of toxin-antitoxin system